ncbi:iron-sulfur cluster assembly protein [Pyrococcus sp. ST04]|uniref:iron-sulfur cluster assembly protein n=1 Tax=Pyrococcus sp. ST04 TaxID=1183377 RepID=UPI00064FE23E|nr:iron-sulfur cluster assembly protein [Pyrococcus sp. ST04]
MGVKEVIDKLRNVVNPFTGIDIVSEGLVTKVIVEDRKVVIYVAFARYTPPGPFAMAITWPVQAKIAREIGRILEEEFEEVEVIDDTTLQRYYPLEEV